MRQNYNLDESKSSVLHSHTVAEFICEKYPAFQFENDTEPKTEDEFYYVASLLLFFVCVNSKDVDIKNAMCSNLCSEDQKIILKFSKRLMECPSISYSDVQAAITGWLQALIITIFCLLQTSAYLVAAALLAYG